jgi:4'-phosphopantetheinyl transferase
MERGSESAGDSRRDLSLGRRPSSAGVTQLLADNAVDVWFARPAEVTNGHLHECAELLDQGERATASRFWFERDRRRYVAAHALLRMMLSHYAPVAPWQWSFIRGEHGKPQIAGVPRFHPLQFSLAHASGMVATAVTRAGDIGVDVENIDRRGRLLQVAKRFFAPEEWDSLRALPRRVARWRFLEYWTLKEAFVKALGCGLSISLRAFAFRITDDTHIDVAFDDSIEEDPLQWRFCLLRPSDRHVAAIAVRRRPSRPSPRDGAPA